MFHGSEYSLQPSNFTVYLKGTLDPHAENSHQCRGGDDNRVQNEGVWDSRRVLGAVRGFTANIRSTCDHWFLRIHHYPQNGQIRSSRLRYFFESECVHQVELSNCHVDRQVSTVDY